MDVPFRTYTRLPSRPGRRGGTLVTSWLRPVAAPFVAAAPAGARVRARLRLSAQDEAVLRAGGGPLGALAREDPSPPGTEGRPGARGPARAPAGRERAP